MNKIIENANKNFMNTYNRYNIVLEKGEGVYLFDEIGKKYLDFGAGIAVNGLGYGNKKYNDALKNQIDNLMHTSNLFYNKASVQAAVKFTKASKMDKVFFTNSGTEAIEGAIKIARKYYYNKTGLGDGEIIAMDHSFHGRSMGALSVTGNEKYQKPFGQLIGNIKFAKYNNLESVKKLINNKTCAIIMETVQGEGGIYEAQEDFIKGVGKLCDDNDMLLILDEVQCGMGRTGKFFAYENYNVMPDILTSAKGLGCGIPVGAFAARGKAANVLVPGDHGSTYGFNPLATSAVSIVFDLFHEMNILDNVLEVGNYLKEKLYELKNKHNSIVDCRGIGLMQGLEFNCNVNNIILKAQEKGLIIISAQPNIIRFVPPLIIEKKHVDEMIKILDECIE